MNKKIFISFILLALVASGIYFLLKNGPKNQLHIDVSKVQKSATIKHFDDAFFTTDTLNFAADLQQLKSDFEPFFSSGNTLDFWNNQRTSKNQIFLYADWKKQVPNYDDFDENLNNAFKHLYYYYPDLPEFKAYTYISNLDFSDHIILSNKFVFMGVDLYLGKYHPAYQRENNYENYTRQKAFLINDVMRKFGQNFDAKNLDDNTLLNEMIWWGKQAYFAQAMQPDAHDTIITRMSRKHLEFCLANEPNIWTFFIDNQLLFDTGEKAKRQFIAPAPFSKFGMPFDNETPGMIGRWLGWRIVSDFMTNNPNVSLPQLMANADYRQIFKLSKYKP